MWRFLLKKTFKTEFKNSSGSIGFLFWKVSNYHQKKQREALKHLDLTPTQFSVLACYYYIAEKLKKNPSQADICEHSGIDKMLVSDITKVLLTKKLILKTQNKTDKRAFEIQLTETGKVICNEAVQLIEKIDHEVFSKTKNKLIFLKMLSLILED